jgi:sulfur carrier protein ThiS
MTAAGSEACPSGRESRIIIEFQGRVTEVASRTPAEALGRLGLPLDAHIVLRDNVPIPLDEPLGEGDRIKVIRVASGG